MKGRAGKREFLEGRVLKGRVGWMGRAEELDNVNRRALKRRAEEEGGLIGIGLKRVKVEKLKNGLKRRARLKGVG